MQLDHSDLLVLLGCEPNLLLAAFLSALFGRIFLVLLAFNLRHFRIQLFVDGWVLVLERFLAFLKGLGFVREFAILGKHTAF